MLFQKIIAVLLGVEMATAADLPIELSTRYVTASKHRAAVGDSVDLSVHTIASGANRVVSGWPENEIKWLFERADGSQRNHDTMAAVGAAKDHVAITLRQAGVTMVGVDFKPREITLDAGQLGELLKRFPSAAGEKDNADGAKLGSRVRHEGSATVLIRSLNSAEPSAIATSKTGQRAEIRPFIDPTLLALGGDLPLKVYADGDKATGARVRIVPPQGEAIEQTSNPNGMVTISIHASGVWRIEMQQFVGAVHDSTTDWVFYSDSLTFEVPAADGEKAGATK